MSNGSSSYACPNCGTCGMEVFHECRQIPAHSCLMMETQPAALAFPRRDLTLGFCHDCGFIANVIYDVKTQAYASNYEDQQLFSPRFRAFQSHLVQWLVETYGVRHRTVLEIGCSKGDFLIELCQAGGNRGIGVDPSCDPGRVDAASAAGVEFIADYYGEQYRHLPADVICCRHTLEHIPHTGDFIETVRRAIGDRLDTLVFFEVPDAGRVLREQAFWDIYYEHCSYFNLGSLARVFGDHRFEVIELAKDYDDQYLLLMARPTRQVTFPKVDGSDGLEQITHDVAEFQSKVSRQIEAWQQRIQQWHEHNRRIAIWGSGSKCVSFLSNLHVENLISHVIDINPHRQGKFLAGSGILVQGPEILRRQPADVVLVMNPVYTQEIHAHLRQFQDEAELVAA